MLFGWILFSCQTKPSQEKTLTSIIKDSLQTETFRNSPDTAAQAQRLDSTYSSVTAHKSSRKKQTANPEDCRYIGSLSAKAREQKYPFKQATRIEIISFIAYLPDGPHIIEVDEEGETDTLINKLPENTIRSVGYSDGIMKIPVTQEKIALSKQAIDELTDIFYNYSEPDFGSVGLCYNPRHAIIFYRDNKPFAAVEICFECGRTETYPDMISMDASCSKRWEALKKFFEKQGIKYGMEPTGE